jgi:hypothetical protein
LINDPAERLFAVRILYGVSRFFCTWRFHTRYSSPSVVTKQILFHADHTA